MLGLALLAMAPAAAMPPPVSSAPVLRPAGNRTIRLTAGAMFEMAERAAGSGDTGTARKIYRMLEQDLNAEVRAEARFRLARLLVKERHETEAALLFRQILDEKPKATAVRLEFAGLLARRGDRDAALRQLRAAYASGLPANVARLVDRYSDALRASKPWGASLEAAVAPDTNINRATRSDTLGTVIGDFDIGEDSKGKSGLGLGLRGQTYRRFPISAENNVLVRLSGLADLYGKTRFNDVALDLAAGPELNFGDNRVNIEAGVTQRWFGQKPYLRAARLGVTGIHPLGSRAQVRLSGSVSLLDNRINNLQDGKAYTGEIGLERALTETTGVGLNGSFTRQALQDPGYSTRSWRVGLLGWHDLGRVTVTASGEIGRLKADERLALFPDRRSDKYSRLTIGATFRRLGFGGFAPVARFTIERNRSSIAFYDFRRRRTEFGFERAF